MRIKNLAIVSVSMFLALLFAQSVLACGVCEVTITKQALYSGYTLPGTHVCAGDGQTYSGWYDSDPMSGLQLNTFYDWWVQIQVCTPYTITNVMLSDRFGAEFGVEVIDCNGGTSGAAPVLTTQGNSDKVFLEWNIGTLHGGQCASVWLHVWTDINPAGRQEFTSYGTYYMNSGAVVKWVEAFGKQSLETTPIPISTIEPPCV